MLVSVGRKIMFSVDKVKKVQRIMADIYGEEEMGIKVVIEAVKKSQLLSQSL